VAEVVTEDATLHVEVDGEGEPVAVVAHGLTNHCRELIQFMPFIPGTKVRFCFRGHGHSSSPDHGYRFSDFARDVAAVADAYGADVAVGTSLGAGAIFNLLQDNPDRFRKLVFLLPAGLDVPFQFKEKLLRTADLIDGKTLDQAIEAILSEPDRVRTYLDYPWLRGFDEQMLQGLNTVGVPRAIREIVNDMPLRDRAVMGKVTAPTLLICREGDVIHPDEIGRALVEIMPNAELVMFRDGVHMYEGIPEILSRVQALLAE